MASTVSALLERARAHYDVIMSVKGAKKDQDLWARLMCAHWLEAVEVGRVAGYAATTARGVAHLAVTSYRTNRNNHKGKMKTALKFIEELTREAESGRDIRGELEPLACDLNIGEIIRGEVIVDCGGSPPPPHAPARDLTASAGDPAARAGVLREKSERLAAELPAPASPPRAGEAATIGRATAEDRAAWVAWVDEIARRWAGPLYAQDLARISGAPARWCAAMLREHRALQARGLSEDTRRAHALALSAEAEAIGREAFTIAASSTDERARGAALKLALDALDRRAKILQVHSVELEAPAVSEDLPLSSRLERLGLSEDHLKEIADIASSAITKGRG